MEKSQEKMMKDECTAFDANEVKVSLLSQN